MAKKKATAPVVVQATAKRRTQAANATGESRPEAPDARRMMREAAWRQMFGKTQSKNPFDR